MTTFQPIPVPPYPLLSSPRCSRPASPMPLSAPLSREATRSLPTITPSGFRLHDLAPELQLMVLSHLTRLPAHDLASAVRVSRDWYAALIPHLYASLDASRASRETVFSGLGLDYLSSPDLEARADEPAPSEVTHLADRKVATLSHVRDLTLTDVPGALAVAEVLLAHETALRSVHTLTLAAPVFRNLVGSGLAAFGRPRTGAAFVGETLVARLQPKVLRIIYPRPRGAGNSTFDPVVLARVLAVLLSEWKPQVVEYEGVASDLPPVLGAQTRIHLAGPCSRSHTQRWDAADDMEMGCSAHGGLVRRHLRCVLSSAAQSELLDLIEEGADPTDDGDIDPDDVPDPADAHVAYFGVPCIASVDKDAFLDSVFRLWPAEGDVASRVEFYP